MGNKYCSFELLLVSTWFLGVMAIKFILPSLPAIAEQFHTSATCAKYTISLFLFGKATGMLVFGPLSERYGRKIFMLIGLLLFSIGNIVALLTPSISLLLIARLIQGLGVSGTVIIGRAMINDTYKNDKAAVAFSHIFLVSSIIIACLPLFGSFLATHYHWRITFAVMAGYSLIIFVLCFLFLKESHSPRIDVSLGIKQIMAYYKIIVSHPLFLGYVLCSIFMIAGESAFNTASSFLLIKTYGISKNVFGILITCLALGHLVGTLICGRLVKKYNLVNMMGIGVIILATSTSVMAVIACLGFTNVASLIIPMVIFYIGTGFVMTITAVGAVIPFPKLIGTSSAASLSLSFTFSALSSALMSVLSTQSAVPVSLLIAACGIAAFFSWYFLIVPNRVLKTNYQETSAVLAQ